MSGLVKKLDWDTKHFGFPVARLVAARLTASQMQSALKSCRRNKIRCLYFTVDSADLGSIRQAEKHGFQFVGIRATYFLEAKGADESADYKDTLGYFPELKKMTQGLYRHSRFYFDERFPKRLADKLFLRWLEKVKIYALRQQGKIAGYIGWNRRGRVVRIELLGVAPKFQGRGVGKRLLGSFIKQMRRQGYSKFETATQGSNIAAIRLYEWAGFRIKKSEIDFHKWF